MTTKKFLKIVYENILCDNTQYLIDILSEYSDLKIELSECINFLNRFNKAKIKSDNMVI